MAGDSEGPITNEPYNPAVRWCNPQRLDLMTFVGKDVFAVAHDIYIIFFNYKTNFETVYVANSRERGDGVDALAGHRSTTFAFAEKKHNAGIFVALYPSFTILAEIRVKDAKRYKGICMMECDLIAGLTGFPNYLLSVWCWRTNQRLYRIETGVDRRTQLFMASRTHMLICQCWGDGLNVWEVARCYKKCFVLKRPREEVSSWEMLQSKLCDVCWSVEGQLYAIDAQAKLYNISSDGMGLSKVLEWSDKIEGHRNTCMCSFLSGVLIYGPDEHLRYLRKHPEHRSWKVEWSYIPEDFIVRLVSNSFCDMVTMWTNFGFVYKITADTEEKIEVQFVTLKQRNIKQIQMIAPEFKYVVMINASCVLSIYEVNNAKLVLMKLVKGGDVSCVASPVEPLLAIFGEVNGNYGVVLRSFHVDPPVLTKHDRMCLTHQIVSMSVFSPDGRFLVTAAMSAGHIFIFKVSENFQLTLVRYSEFGRGLADCVLMQVGKEMRCFSIVLFSEKFSIGERIICLSAETGKDNKFAGKMMGPYSRLLPLSTKDTMLAIPHLTREMHILKLVGDKGTTITVKMGPIIDTGHDIKQFNAYRGDAALLTYGFDGTAIIRTPDGPAAYLLKQIVTHRYEGGIKQMGIDGEAKFIVHLGANGTVACAFLRRSDYPKENLMLTAPAEDDYKMDDEAKINTINIISRNDKNYLQVQEDQIIYEETKQFKRQRTDVVKVFETLQAKLVELLEENINEPPLHQLSLSEFNLHQEAKKERLKAAEKEREVIRLKTESRIRAQDKVTAWIKKTCWDVMQSPRIKLFAIHTHYHVENFAILPSHRETWPELQQIEALRAFEMENNEDLFRPWVEHSPEKEPSRPEIVTEQARSTSRAGSIQSFHESDDRSAESMAIAEPHVLSGSSAHHFITIPKYMIPQTESYSFLQMNWLQDITKLNTQNVRLWFNKQFDDLFLLKKREVGLVSERNDRLRFIIEELNKLSDLRGSFHHLTILITDPSWRQEEYVDRLIKVEPEECAIEPYISPSQIVIIPPDPGPKDDFRERALIEMMDGVLEKLWHEEIKKPIPKPQCMLDKDPETFNEEDLRQVFDYEGKVRFRNEERDKYRKMLHAEYAKLSQVLNEGIVKFNQKLKETWLLKLKVDSVIGQENLNLMRLRRRNLDRMEKDEKLDKMRAEIAFYENQVEVLSAELQEIQDQSTESQAMYDSLMAKDRQLDKALKNQFADVSPIIVEQAFKFFRKRPKWHQRATLIPVVLYDLATATATGVRPAMLHPDCVDYFRGVELQDQISNMPPVMDEHMWIAMCKLRRTKIENEIKTRAMVQELAFVDNAFNVWSKAIQTRRTFLAECQAQILELREEVELEARNKYLQLVLPAGQVEIVTSGHMEDFQDATLIPREDIEKINNLILRVGDMKLHMMRKQMNFRKGILAKEWEHAQMKMKLRHMKQELYSYQRLKIPKELQRYLKNKELGYNDEQDYVLVEKENESSKAGAEKMINDQIHRCEELELKVLGVEAARNKLEKLIMRLTVKVSDKRLKEDPLEPIKIRREYRLRMEVLVKRSRLIRQVQANHSKIVMLQTELELLRLKTYPTLASFCPL